ncbi:MAG: methyltransferase domain-containing protein [Ectobacillus sp.]
MPVYLHITGIDLSKEMLVQAKKRAQHRDVALLQMNAEELQFPDGAYDVCDLESDFKCCRASGRCVVRGAAGKIMFFKNACWNFEVSSGVP